MTDDGISFASKTVTRHVVRGVVGLVLAVAAFALIPSWGALSLLLVVPAAVSWRGCPTCWTLGLVQTIARVKVSDACPVPARQGDLVAR